ncbi:hypothetical protein BC833DRAFT_521084 [Globomyces pollinis-pini]|nr:hypothetical protein BC833DRAFT_521084 [Globomyces pollinis-pini]
MGDNQNESILPSLGAALESIDFDTYNDKELFRLQQELARKVRHLEAENLMFEMYLNRVTPVGKEEGDNPVTQQDTDAGQERGKEGRREKKKKGEQKKEEQRNIFLTYEQKSEIATRELEELRDEIQHSKEEWGKIIDNFKAELEEVEIRVAEIKKAVYEFKRDIEQQALNRRTGKVIAERIVRYFEDKIRAKEAIIEKVRLKNVTLKVQKNKLHLQLKQKEEMGEVLHAIDFDQLQIENKQYMQKIEERNSELLKLKMTAGNTMQILNHYKKKLQSLTLESTRLRVEISQRKDLLAKLVTEATVVENEKEKAARLNKWLLNQMDQFRVPDVMDYVLVKASQQELQKKLKGWMRKVEITSMQTKRMRHMWHRMKAEAEEERKDRSLRKAKVSHLPDLMMKVG